MKVAWRETLPIPSQSSEESEIRYSTPACQVALKVCLLRWEGRMYCI